MNGLPVPAIRLNAESLYQVILLPLATKAGTEVPPPSQVVTLPAIGAAGVGFIVNKAKEPALSIYPIPLVTLNTYSVIIQLGDSVQLNAYNASSYSWSPATGLNTTTGATVIAAPSTTTQYIVVGSNTFGCTNDTSVWVTIEDGTSINELEFIRNLQIFPNPSRGEFEVFFNTSNQEQIELRLISAIGEVIIREEAKLSKGKYHKAFNIIELASGIYYLQIASKDEIVNTKIVILQDY